MNVIAARILPMLILTTVILPASNTVNMNELVGKNVEWNLDDDLDNFIDGNIMVEGLTIVTNPINESDIYLICTIIINSEINDSELEMNNANFSWNNISFFKDYISDDDIFYFGVFVGIVRKYVIENTTINEVPLILEYDRSTGLLLGIYIDHGSDEKTYYLKLKNTNLFFNAVIVTPYLIWLGVVIGAVAIIFTMLVMMNNYKKKRVKACFGNECWE